MLIRIISNIAALKRNLEGFQHTAKRTEHSRRWEVRLLNTNITFRIVITQNAEAGYCCRIRIYKKVIFTLSSGLATRVQAKYFLLPPTTLRV